MCVHKEAKERERGRNERREQERRGEKENYSTRKCSSVPVKNESVDDCIGVYTSSLKGICIQVLFSNCSHFARRRVCCECLGRMEMHIKEIRIMVGVLLFF